MRKRLISMASIIVLLSTLVGCDTKHPPALVGNWELEGEGKQLELLKDGTTIGRFIIGGDIIEGDNRGTWKVEYGRLHVSESDGRVVVAEYTISGSMLTLIVDGQSRTLQKAEGSAKVDGKSVCMNRLKHIAIAFHNYQDKTLNAFPPLYSVDQNGKPLHSWRVLLLPYLEQDALHKQIRLDEAWNSPHNSQFHSRVPDVYQCPSNKDVKGTANCTYSVIRDDEHCFPEGGKTLGFHSITDGTSNTIMLVEVKKPFCWMDPTADLTLEEFSKGINVREGRAGSFHSGGSNVALFDGVAHFMPDSKDSARLRALGTRNGGETVRFTGSVPAERPGSASPVPPPSVSVPRIRPGGTGFMPGPVRPTD